MKKYYIEIDGHQSEPLSFEKLKARNISKETLVWHEGLKDWTKAGNMEELQGLFRTMPPALHQSPVYNTVPERNALLSGTVKKVLIGGFALIVFVVLLYSFADKTQVDIQSQTEQNSEDLQRQQQLLNEQSARIAEQERLEAERKEKERKSAIQKRLLEIFEQLKIANQNMAIAKRQLNDATAFQLLRSNRKRNDDINAANENLVLYKKEIEGLEEEMGRLNAEY